MSLLLESPPGAPLRKPPFAGRGAFPLSIAAIVGESVSGPVDVKDEARRLRVEDVVWYGMGEQDEMENEEKVEAL